MTAAEEAGADVDDRVLDLAWRRYSRPVLASLIRLLRDFDLAEEALHEAFLAATRRWPAQGVPDNPVAWLVSAGRFTAIDAARRRSRLEAAHRDIAEQLYPEPDDMPQEELVLTDDQLRLMFLCCNPVLAPQAQVALTLREVCGLSTEEIARAFLVRVSTVAQRIVRAKARLRELGMPYEVPSRPELPARLEAVLNVVYLLFNEGYSALSGDRLIRKDLCAEAIRLGRLLLLLLPDTETKGLLGLMLLHQSRQDARQTESGDIVLLPEQDRTLWDNALIKEGIGHIEDAFRHGPVGPFAIQGAIAAVHSAAATAEATNWREVVGLYDLLLEAAPSQVVRLNRAVAVFMAYGVHDGLEALENVLHGGQLQAYGPAHVAAAEMYRAAGRIAEARSSYQEALNLSQQGPERRLLELKLAQL